MEMEDILNPLTEHGASTEVLALDCEFVEVGYLHVLARVSIVNFSGETVYDSFVKPIVPLSEVTDYVTHITGIKPGMLDSAPDYDLVNEVALRIMSGKLVIGHSLEGDFAKFKSIPEVETVHYIDITDLPAYRKANGTKKSLKKLTEEHLNAKIQVGAHSSVVDARAALALYRHKEAFFQKHISPKEFAYLEDPLSLSHP